MTKKIFVANWKMYATCRATEVWVRSHLQEIELMLEGTEKELVLSPSFDALYPLMSLINIPKISLAAQNCAPELSGAYSGQVSITSLKELGCTYCIVGHSEVRLYACETDELIAKKVGLLLENGIIPIICIGETAHERASRKTFDVLEQQLMHVLPVIKRKNSSQMTVCFAYEPIWAIGGQAIPYSYELSETIRFIKELLSKQNITSPVKILYGGNVNEQTIQILLEMPHLDGYLLGRASLDFQVLKKIVLS